MTDARFFFAVTSRPRSVVAASLLTLGACAAFVPTLVKDTRNTVYLRDDHPVRLADDRLEEMFGDADGRRVLVGIIRDEPGGVFRPVTLQLVDWLTEEIRRLEGVDPERMRSLSTETTIVGAADGLVVKPILEKPVRSDDQALRAQRAAMGFDLYVDTLVSRDGRATVIVAELTDRDHGRDVYDAVLDLARRAPTKGEEIHVAGLGAYSALIGDYIDADAQRLNPVAGLLIVLMLLFAYRTIRSVVLPMLAVAGALAGALGTMSAAGVPFYGITTTLSVILIAIGVADGIHILGHYYGELARDPGASSRDLAVRSMTTMWRPVVVTSVTTAAGFLALSVVNDQLPPMWWYGIFASIGVFAALAVCVFTIPAALTLLRPRQSRVFLERVRVENGETVDFFGRATGALGRWVYRRPGLTVAAWGAGVALALFGLMRLERDNDFKEYLARDEPLYQAMAKIDRHLGITWSLNVIVETEEPGGLYDPALLRQIDALQRYLETLPHVRNTRSLVDFVKQMHQAMNEGHQIPHDPDLIAQYFLLYTASGDPSDFEDVVDAEFRHANVHAAFDSGNWSVGRDVVPRVRRYLAERFDAPSVRVSLAGGLTWAESMDKEIGESQGRGVLVAFVAVWIAMSLSFRSPQAGLFATVPVAVAVLFVYGVMGLTGTWLNFATSMTTAVAIGISVDFAIHTIDRVIQLVRVERRSLKESFEVIYPSTGRALLFNFVAILFGFGVIATSVVPSLREFGEMVATCVTVSFLGSVTLLPALVLLVQPRFLVGAAKPEWREAELRDEQGPRNAPQT